MMDDFAIFILTHGRPDKVATYSTIRRCGYTGKIYIIIDNQDKTAARYYEIYGKDQVIMFDKSKIADQTDEGYNGGDRRSIIYARNASFQIARDLGLTYFMQLDDDYSTFAYRMDGGFRYLEKQIKQLDKVLEATLEYYKAIPAMSIAFAQGGDYIGGVDNNIHEALGRRRKCMNTIICSVDRPYKFVGKINEDVNTYTWYQSLGNLFLTFPLVKISQKSTQQNSGGMTDIYKDGGTFVKSFYTVMYAPSCTRISSLGVSHHRIHHAISWDHAVPCIIKEKHKKEKQEVSNGES